VSFRQRSLREDCVVPPPPEKLCFPGGGLVTGCGVALEGGRQELGTIGVQVGTHEGRQQLRSDRIASGTEGRCVD
jgi:hypothetical protein